MFSRANSFNGDVSSWNVTSVTNMNWMFYGPNSFNGDVSSWDGPNSFNGDVSSWDVSSVLEMEGICNNA